VAALNDTLSAEHDRPPWGKGVAPKAANQSINQNNQTSIKNEPYDVRQDSRKALLFCGSGGDAPWRPLDCVLALNRRFKSPFTRATRDFAVAQAGQWGRSWRRNRQ
jgi:hypothetical protein